jgi:Glucose / Sorbosone dehydrogenase
MGWQSHRLKARSLALWVVAAAAIAFGVRGLAQRGTDRFPTPIPPSAGAVLVGIVDFAQLPGAHGTARMMLMTEEPGGRRLFVNDMNGPLYALSEDGTSVAAYLDLSDAKWGVALQAAGAERGFQSFALHPQFNERGARGFATFYTYSDTRDTSPRADFLPSGTPVTHDTVLLEWIANDPAAAVYDGGPPREILRWRQPFVNHNAGLIAFNPHAMPGSEDDGLLYIASGDGGSGGDPFGHAQSLASGFGKILRIDPFGRSSANRAYGIPESNPFARDVAIGRLGEIYAYGLRNPQRFAWDRTTGDLWVADIGQDAVEEISRVTAGANLGWNTWEGSFPFSSAPTAPRNPRADPGMTFPVVEYGHRDPLLLGGTAVTGVVVYRGTAIPQLGNLLLFGDNPSGEVFYFHADDLPDGGQDAIRRVLFRDGASAKTLLQLIRERRPFASRVDLRFGTGPDDRVFLLNKQDGVIRELAP